MRWLVIAAVHLALLLTALPPVSAQTQPAVGVVRVELRPNAVEVEPGVTDKVQGTVNATIECESGYSPSRLEIRADPRSLRDSEDNEVWTISPSFAAIDLAPAGPNRYEANIDLLFGVGANEPLQDLKGRIEFQLYAPSGMTDCGLFGNSWRFETAPFIDVAMRTDEPIQQGQGVPPAAAPEPFNPAEVIVEDGPVRGESHVPSEAFWSMGTIVAVASSYGAYEWRRGRKP